MRKICDDSLESDTEDLAVIRDFHPRLKENQMQFPHNINADKALQSILISAQNKLKCLLFQWWVELMEKGKLKTHPRNIKAGKLNYRIDLRGWKAIESYATFNRDEFFSFVTGETL